MNRRAAILFPLLSLPAVAGPVLQPGVPHAMVLDVASSSEVAFAGRTEVVSRSLLRVVLEPHADGVAVRQQVCDVRLLSDSRAKTILPESFIRSLPPQDYVAAVSAEGRFTADPGETVVGFDASITGGAVPRRAGDPGVTDPDGDGHPGVTVLVDTQVIGTVRIYVAQRGHSTYAGVVSADGVRGQVHVVSLDQRTLGASFAPFAANPTVTPVPAASRFLLQPLAQDLDCAALEAAWDGGFVVPEARTAPARPSGAQDDAAL